MNDITEGLGTAIEGGLLSKAVEPKHSDAAAVDQAGVPTCLNCGTVLAGAHCSACGQKGEVHRSLSAIGHEIMHGVLHLDGKIWRTLPLLLFKPGQLTRRYIDGERAKFVGPMAMFLFSVFLMFAVFQMVGLTAPSDINPSEETVVTIERAGAAARAETAQSRQRIEQRLSELPQDSPERAELQAELEGLEIAEALLGEGTEGEPAGDTPDSSPNTIRIEDTGIGFLDAGLIKKWRENPELMVYKLQANGYKFSWLLIPLSIPFVWSLFFWKRRFKAYDHAIFVTYSIAFMSLLYIILSVLSVLGLASWILTVAALAVPPIHIYKQMRQTYALSRFGAAWRLLFMLVSVLIVALVFFQILIVLGAF